jgi:hypothetical protein
VQALLNAADAAVLVSAQVRAVFVFLFLVRFVFATFLGFSMILLDNRT